MLGELFQKVLDMSLIGCYSILIVMAVRLLLLRFERKFTYYLWFVVFLNLCIPFSFQGGFSLIPSFVAEFSVSDAVEDVLDSRVQSGSDTVTIPTMPNVAADLDNNYNVTLGNPGDADYLSQASAEETTPLTIKIVSVVWLAGIAVLFAWSLTGMLRLKKKISKDHWIRFSKKQGIAEVAELDTPFLWGILRPIIYLPAHLEPEEMRYIVAHEQYHKKRKDYLMKVAVFLVVAIHWFNPLVWAAYTLFCRDMEISCDEAVLLEFKGNIRKQYAGSLLKYAAKQNGFVLSPITFGEPAVKTRIKNVLRFRKHGIVISLLMVICVAGVAAGLVLRPLAEEKMPQEPSGQNLDMQVDTQEDADTDELAINTQLLQYLDMTYAQFKEQIGTEAEFYHGLYFQAPISGKDANAVFQGNYDDEVAGSVLSDEDRSFRIESSLNNIISGITKEMTVEEFTEMLDRHAGFAHEMHPDIKEGLTAYYVAYHYVETNIDSNGDGVLDIQLNIALDDSDHIMPDTPTWIYESTFFEDSKQDAEPSDQDTEDSEQDTELSKQDEELINRGIHNNEHNIYTGNIGNEEIRMMITRTEDSLYAAYTTRSGEGKVFQGNLANNAAGFVLNTDDGEYLNGMITETDDGYFMINGEGALSQSNVTFTLYQESFITMGDDLVNYYDFFGYNADEAERFAQQIKDSVNEKTAFAGLIQYPISIVIDGDQIMIENEESMIDIYDRLMEQNGFKQQIENIYTKYMFANYMGICVEDGIMWINMDSSRDYKITAINPPL